VREFSFFHHCLGNGSSEREILYCCVRNGPQVFSYIKGRGEEVWIERKGGRGGIRDVKGCKTI
jgi:phosphosulfolactate phosphohydrolase-like enzyme